MTRVISCVNQKGGVGKTTLCANLTGVLAHMGHKVIVIDIDPQGHLSQHLGIRASQNPLGIYDVLQGDALLLDVGVEVAENLYVVPPGESLVRLESVQMKAGRGLLLRKALENIETEGVDFVVIDCPPSNGFLVVNAIAASQELLIPVTPDYLGLSGISAMTKQIKRYEEVMGRFDNLWIVVSRFQRRAVSKEAEAKLRHYFGRKVVAQVIYERAVTAECPGHGQPVIRYAPRSKSSKEFIALAQHILGGESRE
ncbi:ParA family protein [Alteromonas sp. ASW11-36]|uniref:ParA family protein n=1 Tax=Alteromonas arenosi TaxID=3055817 RepID=A0ABT7T0D0_9ALTE|nr:ParA family protein [Alteromonas sp. ASW11-36]MDM7861896.1 ParA family protein [Alteromonas sp. ASW11-36]